MPYTYRTVQIELTPEQEVMLKPRILGSNFGKEVTEERGQCWLEESENATAPLDKQNLLWCERCGGMLTNHNTEAHDLLTGKSPNGQKLSHRRRDGAPANSHGTKGKV